MNTQQAVAARIRELCRLYGLTPNGLSNLAGVSQSTVKSILNGESKNPGVSTIKKLCDGLEITLGEFFSTPEFDALEQEIRLGDRRAEGLALLFFGPGSVFWFLFSWSFPGFLLFATRAEGVCLLLSDEKDYLFLRNMV